MGRWDGLDRRRFPRVKFPCMVIISDAAGKPLDAVLTHTENVGVGGVCIVLKKDIKMFSPVEVELDLLDLGEHIRCPGRVVWNVQRQQSVKRKPLYYDLGVEFQGLGEKERRRLEEVVNTLVKNNAEVV